MRQRHLLVTGGAGFIGANFVHDWCARRPDDRLVVLDALTYAGNRSSLAALESRGAIRFEQLDINDREGVERLMREEAIDTLVHFAAESHVDRSIHGPGAFVQANLVGTFSLLEAARAAWLQGDGREHRFHHVSTDEVYGSLGPEDPAFAETNRYLPNSPYAASKAGSDHMVRAYHHTYGLQVTTSNCSNNYGPYQFPEKLIPLMIVNVLEGRPLPIYGDGRNVRDWLHVADHCRGIERVIDDGRIGETYNIGGDNEWANLDLVRKLCELMDDAFAADPALGERFPGSPATRGETAELITFVTDRAGHDRRYAIDGSKIAAELGFSAKTSFDQGLRSTIRWYLDNEAWWRAVMDGSYREWVATNYRA
jgi:dTDP-glucose 4,6-dehydratase